MYGYGGYNRRGGYNNRGYNYNRGYNNNRNYNRQPQYQTGMFDIGDKVIHRATGTELTVISIGREQYECRKPDLSNGWFYEHELEAPMDTSDNNQPKYNNNNNTGRTFKFDVGQKVIHRATGTELIITRHGREQYECRKPDLSIAWFYEDELEAM